MRHVAFKITRLPSLSIVSCTHTVEVLLSEDLDPLPTLANPCELYLLFRDRAEVRLLQDPDAERALDDPCEL